MRLFKLLFKLILFLLPIVLLGLPLFLVVSAVQPLPLVDASGSVEQEDVGRARELFDQHDPRDLKDGEIRPVTMLERVWRFDCDPPGLGPIHSASAPGCV